MVAYAESKLANLLFVRELAARGVVGSRHDRYRYHQKPRQPAACG